MKLFYENPIFWNSEIESDNLTVWNSEIISFDFTEKSLQFIEKYKRIRPSFKTRAMQTWLIPRRRDCFSKKWKFKLLPGTQLLLCSLLRTFLSCISRKFPKYYTILSPTGILKFVVRAQNTPRDMMVRKLMSYVSLQRGNNFISKNLMEEL